MIFIKGKYGDLNILRMMFQLNNDMVRSFVICLGGELVWDLFFCDGDCRYFDCCLYLMIVSESYFIKSVYISLFYIKVCNVYCCK